jgi:hypothetical protein
MSDFPFQYAVLRYIHDPMTQEFLNIGVVVYSREARYLNALISSRYGRVSQTFDTIDSLNYRRMINSVRYRIEWLGQQIAQPTFFDDYPQQIETLLNQVVLTPDDSSLLFGGVGGGLAQDLDDELNRLYMRLVSLYVETTERESRTDEQVWSSYSKSFAKHNILSHLSPATITTPTVNFDFRHVYKNEKYHPIEVVSFDLVHAYSIDNKASRWIGNALVLADSDEVGTLYLLLGAPSDVRLRRHYEYAIQNLETKITKPTTRVVREENIEEFSEEFAEIIRSHS